LEIVEQKSEPGGLFGRICQESHSTAADNSPPSRLSTTNIPIPTTSTLHSTTPVRLDDTLSADSFSRLPSPRFHGCLPNSTLTRDYAIAVDRGHHSTKALLSSKDPSPRDEGSEFPRRTSLSSPLTRRATRGILSHSRIGYRSSPDEGSRLEYPINVHSRRLVV
jgi:hypothetical protein